MATSTSQRYGVTIREFGEFLNAVGITELRQIDKPLVERFKVWRVARIKAKKFARGATGLALDAAILHRIFNFAVGNDMVVKNPVRMEGLNHSRQNSSGRCAQAPVRTYLHFSSFAGLDSGAAMR
jgi:site-specific recombinase XerD